MIVAGALLALGWATPAAAGFESYAIVQDDGTLAVAGRTVRLHGVHLLPTSRVCRTAIRPARCGSEAVLALRFRIQGFVRCRPVRRHRDRTIEAVCYVDGQGSIFAPDEDLGAYLLKKGLAVADRDAPPAYAVLERIARAQGRGV